MTGLSFKIVTKMEERSKMDPGRVGPEGCYSRENCVSF